MTRKFLISTAILATIPGLAIAQDAGGEPAAQTQFILTSVLFLLGGVMVFWMAAGFAMLEAGLVRSKNVTMQLTKNIALFSIAAIMYWLVGYGIMYPGDWLVEGWLGPFFAVTSLAPVGVGVDVGGRGLCLWRVRLFLPTDVLRHHRVHCVGHTGRAHQTVALPCLRGRTDRFHLSD